MKLIIMYILLGCVWGCGEPEGYRFTMKGRVPGMKYGTVFIRSNDADSRVLASAELENYEFNMKGELAEPGCYVLQVNDVKKVVVLDGRELVAEFTGERGASLKALKGSPAQECLKKHDAFIREGVDNEHEKRNLSEVRFERTCAFIAEHPDNIASAFIATKEMGDEYEKGIKMYGLLSERVRQLEIGKVLQRKLERAERSAVGRKFPEIEVCSIEGDTLILKEWSGSVSVVDFWASWCGPCRKELQHLKALYKELEGKGVKFVSVSLDNSPKAWARADEEEQLPWLSVRNLHGFDRKAGICKELDIKSIPFIVVLDKDGAIVAKSLMGEALRDKLSELLK